MIHKIICGDNLENLDLIENASIDFIYIDPPYATLGKKGNKYSDYFNSHKEWQDFLKPRLEKGRNKLKETGSIAVSIDNTNLAYLILTLNEVFNEKNFINTFIWIKQKTNKNGTLNTDHEYIVAYARNIKKVVVNKQVLDVENDTRYKYTDERANYFLQPNSNIQSAYGGGDHNTDPIAVNGYLLTTEGNQSITFTEGCKTKTKYDPIEVNSFQLNRSTFANSKDNDTRYKEPFRVDPMEASAIFNTRAVAYQKEPIKLNTYWHQDGQVMGMGVGNNPNPIPLDNTYALGQSEVDKALDYKSGNKQQAPILLNSYTMENMERNKMHIVSTEPVKNETILIYPRTSWRWCKEKIDWAMKENLVVFKQNKNKEWRVYFKQYKYLTTAKIKGKYCLIPIERTKPYSTIIEGCTNDRILAKIFGPKCKFHYSKPIKLIEHLLNIFTKENDTVLDFFGGSGTTTHAAFNKNRNSILIQNNEGAIFDEVLIPRLDYCKINYEK